MASSYLILYLSPFCQKRLKPTNDLSPQYHAKCHHQWWHLGFSFYQEKLLLVYSAYCMDAVPN